MKFKSVVYLAAALCLMFAAGLQSGLPEDTPQSARYVSRELFKVEWGHEPGRVGLLRGPDRNYGPRSLEVDERSGRAYILDSENRRINVYDLAGSYFRAIGIEARADDLLLTGRGTVYVLDGAAAIVKEYSLEGSFMSGFSVAGIGKKISGLAELKGRPYIETADGFSLPLFERGKTAGESLREPERTMERRVRRGIGGDGQTIVLERRSAAEGRLMILGTDGSPVSEIRIPRRDGNIETLMLAGRDASGNICIIVEESVAGERPAIKRYLRKYSPAGRQIAEALIGYSNFTWVFRDLRITPSGRLYQLLPAEDGVRIIVWEPGRSAAAGGNDATTGMKSMAGNRPREYLLSADRRAVLSPPVSLFGIGPDEIIQRASGYSGYTRYIGFNNITPETGAICWLDGLVVITPVRTPGDYTGVMYKWGGFSGLEGFSEYTDSGYFYGGGLDASLLAGDINWAEDKPGSLCAVGVDCSGFVSQAWGLSARQSTSSLPGVSFALYANDYLEAGDVLNAPRSHVMLFEKRETDGRYTVYESSGVDWKVSSRSYYAYEIEGYWPYRYAHYSDPDEFPVGGSVEVVTSEDLAVRSDHSGSAAELYTVTYPAVGEVLATAEDEDILWVQVQWQGQATAGWSNSAPMTRVETVPVTVETSPAGLEVTVDGTDYTAPGSFNWVVSSEHTIGVGSPQAAAAGVRYTFASWSDGGAQTHTVTAGSSAATYTAAFTTQYLLSTGVSPPGSGSVSPSGENWYDSGEVVSVQASPAGGYSFVFWSGDASGSDNPVLMTMTGPASITANFSGPGTAVVTLATSPAGFTVVADGTDHTSPVSFSWAAGSTHSIGTYSPQDISDGTRHVFGSWSDGGAMVHTVTAPSSDTTFTASFVTQYLLTTAVSPAGKGTVDPPGNNWFVSGDPVTILATAISPYVFSHWSGDAAGSDNPVIVNMTGPKSVTANFIVPDEAAYPPDNPGIEQLVNNYIFFKEYINRLTWEFNDQNLAAVTAYKIYAKVRGTGDENYRLIAQVGPQSFVYDHRGLKQAELFTYRITTFNELGNESLPAEIGN